MPARVDLATPAEPDQAVSSIARARLKAAALGVVGALLVPLPAAAAPAPCEQALRYAAQSGTQLMRIGTLDLGPAGRTGKPLKDVGLGDAKSALVAQSPINAAALGRVLDGAPTDRKALTEVFQQAAPPSHKTPEHRVDKAIEAGPFRVGRSELTVHARWDPRMACGNAAGEATRSEAELRRAGVLEDGDGSLVRVPGKISGRSTTAMERRGPAARAAAAASMSGGTIEVLGGAVKIKLVKPPSLLATMSGTDGGEVRYEPAVVEVSGEGFETARMDTAGDSVELRLDEVVADDDGDRRRAGQSGAGKPGAAESGAGKSEAAESGAGRGGVGGGSVAVGPVNPGQPGARPAFAGERDAAAKGTSNDIARKPEEPTSNPDKDGTAGLFAGLPQIGALESAGPLPVPVIPGVPPLATDSGTEAAPADGPGTTVKISLGDVRQAVSGHAIAAKATAMTIVIAKGPDRQAYADSATNRTGLVLDLDMGLLEAAAVAPEPAGGVSGATGGGGGGLPITGPRVDVLALTGVALLIAGAGALIFGLRGRPRP
ncbi:hypothetical protein [Actinoplanes sp. NPDC049599]|uniref:hypothetical protein n=1 Tax=Actinoplanes sp. NPDC049599 TaxID=3363903 RepID=UPI00378A8928